MDSEIEASHVVKTGELKPQHLVRVTISSKFNRKQVSSISEENSMAIAAENAHNNDQFIDDIWRQRLHSNPRLFNATKFRIHDVVSEEENGIQTVRFFLGVTDYKEFIGTNWAPTAHELQAKGAELFGNSQIFLSDALGVGAAVITKDNCIILLRRSEHCAEAPSLYDIPGGHAEPKELVGNKTLQEIDLSLMTAPAVIHEIFDSIVREVVDEVNIPREALSEPLYVGTHRNKTSAGRPSVAFTIKCSITSDEVRHLYSQGNQLEADESTNIMFISVADLPVLEAHKNGIWTQLAPSAKGNLTVFCIAHGLRSRQH